MQLTLTTAPTVEPVALTEAKTHLRITGTDDDTYVTALIIAARQYTEQICNRVFVSQSWTLYLDAFPFSDQQAIELPRPPLISVTSVKYYDNDDVLQTWAASNYTVDTDAFKGCIYPARLKSWPTPRDYPKSVQIEFVAGYSDTGASPQDLADNVPVPIKQALKILIAHMFENREPVIVGTNIVNVPLAYHALIAPYRVYEF